MNRTWRWPILGLLAALAITSTMDATGYSAFSSLPLFPLLALLWYLQRFSAKDIGFAWGQPRALRCYGLAILYVAVAAALWRWRARAGAFADETKPVTEAV